MSFFIIIAAIMYIVFLGVFMRAWMNWGNTMAEMDRREKLFSQHSAAVNKRVVMLRKAA